MPRSSLYQLDCAQIQAVLDRLAINSIFPYPTRFIAAEVDGEMRVQADLTVIRLEDNKPGRGIPPDICYAPLPPDADEEAIARCAHAALIRAVNHEVDESLTFDGKHVVEPHPVTP